MSQVQSQTQQVEYALMSDLLREFRQQLECEAGAQVHTVELNAALLLSDLCEFLGLDAGNQVKVLGALSWTFTHQFKGHTVTLSKPAKVPPSPSNSI
jgi:hypothetical protein